MIDQKVHGKEQNAAAPAEKVSQKGDKADQQPDDALAEVVTHEHSAVVVAQVVEQYDGSGGISKKAGCNQRDRQGLFCGIARKSGLCKEQQRTKQT